MQVMEIMQNISSEWLKRQSVARGGQRSDIGKYIESSVECKGLDVFMPYRRNALQPYFLFHLEPL